MSNGTLNLDPATVVRNSQAYLRRSLASWQIIYKDNRERYLRHLRALLSSQYSSMRTQGVAHDQAQAAITEIETEHT